MENHKENGSLRRRQHWVPGLAQPEETDVIARGGLLHAFERRRSPLWPGGPLVSGIGFGAQRLRVDDPTLHQQSAEALEHALNLGVNLVDVATADLDGQSELLVGEVLAQWLAQPGHNRSQLVLIGKVGNLLGHAMERVVSRERAGKTAVNTQFLTPTSGFSFAPDVLREQVELSLERLRVAALDVILVESPERLLQWCLHQGVDEIQARRLLRESLCVAFRTLEELRQEGIIGSFGVSSRTLAYPRESFEALRLEDIIEAAESAEARDGFRVVSAPLNWVEVAPLLAHEDQPINLLDQCQAQGVGFLAQRPLNALSQGQLIRLTRPQVPTGDAPLSLEMQRGLENWAQLARDLETLGHEKIDALGWEDVPLSQLAIGCQLHMEGVQSVLVGMRRKDYVEDMLEACGRPVLLKARDRLLSLHGELEFHRVDQSP